MLQFSDVGHLPAIHPVTGNMLMVLKTSVVMAKGRKYGSSYRDRLLGSYGYGRGHTVNGTDISELVEEDVWSVIDHDDSDSAITRRSNQRNESGSDSTVRSRQWATRDDRQLGGLSLAFEESGKATARIVHQFRPHDSSMEPSNERGMATSAPMNVPDWPKILRVESVESLGDENGTVEYDDDDAEWVPPHEYLAREYAQSQKMAATSVFEGVGRTLKGRDMSRVRNAVWSRTGFLG
ncbi:protein S40-5-like [Magnolia sinica]|uniref:protein S40-5-like n=1 Tax=Magnolia sinica TaxID=86752 RepID=UPI00265A9745|nr:protein S40-5-like [Magnolia sinica]